MGEILLPPSNIGIELKYCFTGLLTLRLETLLLVTITAYPAIVSLFVVPRMKNEVPRQQQQAYQAFQANHRRPAFPRLHLPLVPIKLAIQ